MGLRLYNTLTRTKQDFVPIDPGNVRMYVCGPTVYDFAHIGNARPLIVFDVLYRLLRHLYPGEGGAPDGSRVTYVRNITDVDDKINARAARDYPDLPLNEAIREVTSRTEAQFHADVAALGCLPPTVEPRATDHIAEMRTMIDDLVDKGFAYPAEEHVLFDVAKMPDYGKLSNRSLDDMIAGARVEVAPYKKNPMDFVLWKPSKPGEPGWPSPAGIAEPGRPGWHLECSAMSDKWLWEEAKPTLSDAGLARPHEFDIHGGGIDLVFPHHENEIAQSRCAHGTDVMANYWLHNGFLQVEGEKMAKSAGNFVTIRELLKDWPGEVIRLNMLKTHYRQPIDWTLKDLEAAQRTLDKWREVAISPCEAEYSAEVITALSDDLNTPKATSFLHGPEFHKRGTDGQQRAEALMHGALALLGLDAVLREGWPDEKYRKKIEVSPGVIHTFIEARAAARAEKNWAEADRIRDELDAMGIALKDAKDPETGELVTTWEVKR
ncbi:cysteine--tRNA ligase [Bauldia litoralis]|uniref:cysteine--tRNA ligase n=1 Tax=Bauldia litoralis TaxID=665467 RepID=UPI003264EDA9